MESSKYLCNLTALSSNLQEVLPSYSEVCLMLQRRHGPPCSHPSWDAATDCVPSLDHGSATVMMQWHPQRACTLWSAQHTSAEPHRHHNTQFNTLAELQYHLLTQAVVWILHDHLC